MIKHNFNIFIYAYNDIFKYNQITQLVILIILNNCRIEESVEVKHCHKPKASWRLSDQSK